MGGVFPVVLFLSYETVIRVRVGVRGGEVLLDTCESLWAHASYKLPCPRV